MSTPASPSEPITVEVELVRLRNELEIAQALQLGVIVKVAARYLGKTEAEMLNEVTRNLDRYRVTSKAETRTTTVGRN